VPIAVPGITTGAAHAAGDALGISFIIPVPRSGIIQTAILYDLDDEGIETDLVLFSKPFTGTADDAAFDVSDVDLPNSIGTITWSTFKNFASNQVSTAAALGLAYVAPEKLVYCQMVTRGAPNIAAANIPLVSLIILADE